MRWFRLCLVVLLPVVAGLGCWACQEELMPQHARLEIQPQLPMGIDPLDLDSLWVYAENVRSGRVDSLLSQHAQSVVFDVEVGNYTVRALGKRVTPKVIYRFSGVALNQALPQPGRSVRLSLERSLTLNPDAPVEWETVECSFSVVMPPEASSLSLLGGVAKAANLLTQREHLAYLDAQGTARFQLPKGSYRVEVMREVSGSDGKQCAYYAVWQSVSVEKVPVMMAPKMLELLLEQGDMAVRYDVQLRVPAAYPALPMAGVRVTAQLLPNGAAYEALTDAQGHAQFALPTGSYRVGCEQVQTLDEPTLQVRSFAGEGFAAHIEEDGQRGELPLRYEGQTSAVVIKEVYFTASTAAAPGGGTKPYGDDKFFEIYNNSPFTIYADGISMCATKSNTMIRKSMNFFPEYIGTDIVVAGLIFTVPGDGTSHPMPPGTTMLFADIAIDHRGRSFSTVDLSKADFEWYDNDPRDMDVPEVPNLEKWFSYSKTVTALHVRGYWGLFIMKGDAPMQEFLPRYLRPGVFPNGTSTMIYCIPKEYILDAVQCAAPEGPKTQVFPPSLDAGYTFCTKAYSGRSIRRRVSHRRGDHWVLMDTNNSSDDFHTDATPAPREVMP